MKSARKRRGKSAHVYIRGHGYAAAVVGYDVATLVLAFCTLTYLVLLGHPIFEYVLEGGEGPVVLKPSIVSDLMEIINSAT